MAATTALALPLAQVTTSPPPPSVQTPLRTCCGQLHGRARASPAAHARRSAARNAVRDTPKGSRSCFAPVDGAARAAPQHPRASYARVLERPSPYPRAACARVRSASTRACERCPKFLRHVTLSPRCCGAPAGGRARAPARTRPSSRAATHAPSAPSPSAVRAPATGNAPLQTGSVAPTSGADGAGGQRPRSDPAGRAPRASGRRGSPVDPPLARHGA